MNTESKYQPNSGANSIEPNKNDAQLYHMFEGLLLVGVGVLLLVTRGESFGFSDYSDNLVFFIVAFYLTFGGAVRIFTAFNLNYFAKYWFPVKFILLSSEGAYLLIALSMGQYGHIPFVAALFFVNLVRVIIKLLGNELLKISRIRFGLYLLFLAVIGGLVVSMIPETFPFRSAVLVDFLESNQFLFSGAWLLAFIPLLLYTISPLGRNSKIVPVFFALGGAFALVIASELSTQSELSLAYSSYMTGVFVFLVAWWSLAKIKVRAEKSHLFWAALAWVSLAALLGLISIKAVHEQIKEQKAEKMLQNAVSISTHIDSIFDANSSLMRSIIQRNPVLEIARGEDLEQAVSVSRQVYDSGQYLRGVNFVNKDGIALGNYPRNSMVIGTNFSERSYFSDTKSLNKGVIGKFFVNILGNPNLVQTEPFFEDNEFAGILAASVDLAKYSADIKQKIENHSVLFAVDAEGNIVLNSENPSGVGEKLEGKPLGNRDLNITKDIITVRKHVNRPGWEVYLVSETDASLREATYLSVFLTVILITNAFVSAAAAVAVSANREEQENEH